MERGYNEPLHNKVLGIRNDFLSHSNSIKLMEKKILDITKPHYSEQIWPVPLPLIISSSTVPNQEPTIKLLFQKKGKQKAS